DRHIAQRRLEHAGLVGFDLEPAFHRRGVEREPALLVRSEPAAAVRDRVLAIGVLEDGGQRPGVLSIDPDLRSGRDLREAVCVDDERDAVVYAEAHQCAVSPPPGFSRWLAIERNAAMVPCG